MGLSDGDGVTCVHLFDGLSAIDYVIHVLRLHSIVWSPMHSNIIASSGEVQ